MILSFAWTSAALLTGNKSMTRRSWAPGHVAHFHRGDVVDAWDHLPRVKGARRIASIRLTATPYLQRSHLAAAEDFHAEGFGWLQQYGTVEDIVRVSRIWMDWHERPEDLYVVPFSLVSTVCPGCSAVVPGPLGRTGTGELRCCQHCALSARGCRCAAGEPKTRVGAYDLDDQEIRALEEALDR